MADKKEMLMHTIRIDNFMTLEWQIPKEITPLELKAMSYKINKLFNISDVEIAEEQNTAETENTQIIPSGTFKGSKWTETITKTLIELYNGGMTAMPLSEKLFEITKDPYFKKRDNINSKIKYLKITGAISGNNTEKRKFVANPSGINQRFDADDINRLKDMWASGIRVCSKVREEMKSKYNKDFKTTAISNKLWQMKKNGMIKDGQ